MGSLELDSEMESCTQKISWGVLLRDASVKKRGQHEQAEGVADTQNIPGEL